MLNHSDVYEVCLDQVIKIIMIIIIIIIIMIIIIMIIIMKNKNVIIT